MAGIPQDPLSAFVGSIGGGLGKGLGDAIGGGGPLVSGGGAFDGRSAFDGSGWTVSTGSSRATGSTRAGSGSGMDLTGAPSGAIGMSGGLSTAGLGGIGLLMMVGLAVYFIANGGKL